MRAVARRVSALILVIISATAMAQESTRKPVPAEARPQGVAPATAPTREEAAEKVKTPITVQAMPTAAPVDPKEYRLGIEDIIAIRVFREPELSFAAQIRPDGKITMALVGEIQAAGVTPVELAKTITEKLSEFINKPEVSVSVQSVQSRRYYITGEVNRPGSYSLVVPITVLEALTNSGGFREFANTKKITILRKGKIIKFNYEQVTRGKKLEQNIPVENGDYIIVR